MPTTLHIPVELRNPQVAANAGNCFPNVFVGTDWEMWYWQFVKDVVGKLYGIVRVPENVSGSGSPTIELETAWNTTSGVATLGVATKAIADGESVNPGSLTNESDIDVTVPGTALLRKSVLFPAAGELSESLVASDLLIVEITHNGTAANDTVAVDTVLLAAFLKINVN